MNALELTKKAMYAGKLPEQPKQQVLLAYLQMLHDSPGIHPDDSLIEDGGFGGWRAVLAYEVTRLGKFGTLPDELYYPCCVLTISNSLSQYDGFHVDDEDSSIRSHLSCIASFVCSMYVSEIEDVILALSKVLSFHGGGEPEGVNEPLVDLLSNLKWISEIK